VRAAARSFIRGRAGDPHSGWEGEGRMAALLCFDEMQVRCTCALRRGRGGAPRDVASRSRHHPAHPPPPPPPGLRLPAGHQPHYPARLCDPPPSGALRCPQVTDPFTASVLKGLMEVLLSEGCIICCTSNRCDRVVGGCCRRRH
jgi:hypothetical protein